MLVETRDRERIAAWCRRDAGVQAYLLGDLDDFFWPHTRWFASEVNGVFEQVALLYTEPDPPVLLSFGRTASPARADLVRALAPLLPDVLYAHLADDALEALSETFDVTLGPEHHVKLSLDDTSRLDAAATSFTGRRDAPEGVSFSRLSVTEVDEIGRFYACAYPGSWFQERMLETGRYVGIREDGRLVCIAGVHVYSAALRVAALGNVATLPEARGRGFATAACAHVCRDLLGDGIDTISLNVQADNTSALNAYERLGFVPVASYVELMLRRRRPHDRS